MPPAHAHVAPGDLAAELAGPGAGTGRLAQPDPPRGTGVAHRYRDAFDLPGGPVAPPDRLALALHRGLPEDQHLDLAGLGAPGLGLGIARPLLAGGVVDPHRDRLALEAVHGERPRSEEHTSELQSRENLVYR